MNICQDSKINCQLTDLKTESILNDLEQITFNNDSTIVITIQKSYIQAYFQKNEDLKSISSFNVLKDKYYSQLQYLTFSNSFIAIPKSQILISSLNGLNARKFILKIDHGLGLCYKLLLNKNENILFLSYFNEIRIFQKQIIGWKCIDTLQSLSHRDTIQQLCLNFEEDHLVIHTSNGYSGSPTILVYRKKSIEQQIQWVIKQRISVENGMICGFINNNQFLFSDNYSLQFYTQNKDNQKFESENYYNFILSNYQFKSFAFQHQNQVLFIITKNELSVIQLQEQQKLKQRQLIQIDLSKLLEEDVSTVAFNSILTKDGKYLYIWNRKKTKIIRILNN
ncbi:unnamed protein product [Paramecium pentaurelia]|uniref:Uncharacterized protein n=1 Tax=Paramecium pentaurelia TaxID=43138 RepID=A0A8S1YIZ6_9CILI|nr:unnamed protein product [Paramecium pentaurelia]